MPTPGSRAYDTERARRRKDADRARGPKGER